MKNFYQAALGILATFSSPAIAATVSDLTADTFDAFITSHAVVMVEFYAPWCEICKNLEPVYEDAATRLDPAKDIAFARVDCVADRELCDKYRTPIYPTLRLFQGNEQEIYNGKRTADEMIPYAERRLQPPVAVLAGNEIASFRDSADIVIMGYWDAEDTASNVTFTAIAKEHLDYYIFGASTDPEAARLAGVSRPGIVLHKRYDESKTVFKETFEREALTDFIILESIPLVGEFSQKWMWTYFGDGTLPFAGIFAATSAERNALADMIRPLAQELKDVVRFATVDSTEHRKLAEKFGLEDRQTPALAIKDLADQKFVMPFGVELNEASLRQWVEEWRADKLTPWIKPEPDITEISEANVTVVTANNFDDIVLNSDADVLLEFYAPWCGHCKKLAPIYAELATMYAQKDQKVRIGKVDATAHEIPEHPVKSYPTIMFFPAGAKNAPVPYTGGRDLEDFVKFLDEKIDGRFDTVRTTLESKIDIKTAIGRQTGTMPSDEL